MISEHIIIKSSNLRIILFLFRQPGLILILLLSRPNYVSTIIFWLIRWHIQPTKSLERWLYYSKYEILNHNGPGHGIYAHLLYHIDFEIASTYHIVLRNIHLKLSNIVSYLIIGWWNYRLSYRLLKALSAITPTAQLILTSSWEWHSNLMDHPPSQTWRPYPINVSSHGWS